MSSFARDKEADKKRPIASDSQPQRRLREVVQFIGFFLVIKLSSRRATCTHTQPLSVDDFLFSNVTSNESCYKLNPLSPHNNQCKTFLLITFRVFLFHSRECVCRLNASSARRRRGGIINFE